MTVSEELISVLICWSCWPSFDARSAASDSSPRTEPSLPDSAVFTASRNAFALSGLMACRIGPSLFRKAPMSAASWVWLTDRKSTRLNSSHRCISYAVFCLKKKKLHDALRLDGFRELVQRGFVHARARLKFSGSDPIERNRLHRFAARILVAALTKLIYCVS